MDGKEMLSLSKLQEQIKQEKTIRDMLSKEIEKYHRYEGYEKFRKLIENTKNIALIRIRENNFQNVENHIKEMHQEIELIFHVYAVTRQQLREMSPSVYGSRNKHIINEYEKMNRNFRNGEEISATKEAIEYMQSLIDQQSKNKKR